MYSINFGRVTYNKRVNKLLMRFNTLLKIIILKYIIFKENV